MSETSSSFSYETSDVQAGLTVALARTELEGITESVDKCLVAQTENTREIMSTLGAEFQRRDGQHRAALDVMNSQNQAMYKSHGSALDFMNRQSAQAHDSLKNAINSTTAYTGNFLASQNQQNEKAMQLVKDKSEKSEQMMKDQSEKAMQLVKDKSEKSEQMMKDKSEKSEQMIKDQSEKAMQLVKDKSEKSEQLVKDKSEKSEQMMKDQSEKAMQLIKDKSDNSEQLVKDQSKMAMNSVAANTDKFLKYQLQQADQQIQFQREQLKSINDLAEKRKDSPRGSPSNAMGGAAADGGAFSPCRLSCGENANIMFMPCHHIVCCSACASFLKMCPECRGEIKTMCELRLTQ